MKIISVVGARPNFMKVAPLHRVFTQSGKIDSIIVHTGQHYDRQMSQIFFEQLELPEPHYYLGVGSGTHTEQTARIMLEFEKVLDQENPDLVIVVGDVNSTVACALTAVKKSIKVAHVEAGLRSGDRRMPEEINRIVTDAVSDFLFVSEQSGIDNLLREGIDPEKIFFTGNVMIDSLVQFLPAICEMELSRILISHVIDPDSSRDIISNIREHSIIVVTLHRPSNVDDVRKWEKLVDMICDLTHHYTVIFTVHPRTRKNLEKFGFWETFINLNNLLMTGPLGYLEFIRLMKGAKAVITDSGGVQEETTYLGVPCFTLRENTERPVTLEVGTNELIPVTVEDFVEKIKAKLESLDTKITSTPPFLWDGSSALRIQEQIFEIFDFTEVGTH